MVDGIIKKALVISALFAGLFIATAGSGATQYAYAYPPVVRITSPEDGSVVSTKTLTFGGSSSDDKSGVQVVELKVTDPDTLELIQDYTAATPASAGDWSTWTHKLTFDQEGSYRVTARATDGPGNQGWYSVIVDIDSDAVADNVLPSIAITSPSTGSTVAGPLVSFSGTASDDDSGVQVVELKVTDPDTLELIQDYTAATPASAGDWSTWTHKLTFDQEGSYRVTARVEDNAGNQRWISVILNTNISPIGIVVTSPSDESTLPVGYTTVSGTASAAMGLQAVEVKIDSGDYMPATPKSPGDWSAWSITVNLSSGSHRILARATDNTGNPAWYDVHVTASGSDTKDPIVTVTSPKDGATLPAGVVTISGTALDNVGGSGIREVEVRLDDSSYTTATPKSPGDWSTWSITMPVANEGWYDVTARATDNAGNKDWDNDVDIYLTLDGALDVTTPTVSITSPADDSVQTAGTLTISGKAADTLLGSSVLNTGVSKVQVKVDSGSYKTATPRSAGDWSTWSVPVSISSRGMHDITALVTDKAGNYKTHTISIMASPGTEDKFGITEIHPTKSGGREWFINMADPDSDGIFDPRGTIKKNSDGSWRISDGMYNEGQVRMYVYTPSGQPEWHNVEVTGYLKPVSGTGDKIQWFTRSGENDRDVTCESMSYRGRIHMDGDASLVKKLWHSPTGGYSHPEQEHDVTDSVMGRWIGWKLVVHDKVVNGKTVAHIETYIDDRNNDKWVKVMEYDDAGRWPVSDSNEDYYTDLCDRSANHIITESGPITSFRSDYLVWDFKNLSVREIEGV